MEDHSGMASEWFMDLRNTSNWSQYGKVLGDFRVKYTHPTTQLQDHGDEVLALTPELKLVLDKAPSGTTFCNHSTPNRGNEPDWRYVELLLRIATRKAALRMRAQDQGNDLVALWACEHQRLGGSTGNIQISTVKNVPQNLIEALAGSLAAPAATATPPWTPPAEPSGVPVTMPGLLVSPPSPAVAAPILVGSVPRLASAFQDRTSVRHRIDRARDSHATTVLTQVLSGGGGVGKSQMAAAYAHQALAAGTELVVWANATEIDQITALYAQAAHRVQAPGAQGVDAESDAQAFMTWLATTSRSWLVVLDDITDPNAAEPWWPPPSLSSRGWVLATTRRREAQLSGGGRTVIPIDTYTPSEAAAYLRDRLTTEETTHLLDDRAVALATTLGLLPLALAHAAAYMINEDVNCSQYLHLFNDSTAQLDDLLPRHADTEGYGRQVAAALLLSLDAAQKCDPIGLAVPALRLAAVLDPAGHPQTLWTGEFFDHHLEAHHAARPGSGSARAALRLLHRYGLITDNFRNGPRAVQVHALTARAALEITPAAELPATVRAAADALLELWPEADHTDPELCAVLRANTDILHTHAADLLWGPDSHPVLYRAGHSLSDAGLYTAAIVHWDRLVTDALRLLGSEHHDTLTARANLASSYRRAGRTAEAVALLEQVVADSERLLGPEHSDTLTARANLATSYRQAGRTAEAIVLLEQVLTDAQRLLGPEHSDTLTVRNNLATSYRQAGRTAEAIVLLKRVLDDALRLWGAEHHDTLAVRSSLASSYRQVGRTAEAVALLEQVVADSERLLGPQHHDTLTVRANLASSYRQAGRTAEAIVLLEQVLDDALRLWGAEHHDTLAVRSNLASSYSRAGRTAEAVALLEQVVADSERLLGPQHHDTLTNRGKLEAIAKEGGTRSR
ncbi:FxSxx-COOH system tetratricopeptide repeat protein [Streptomyces sp. NBC_01275]|uniref:FxSxx-COOH system tetratricopeptide repeat protein n=1 Tax=Streptomyces sp. NBC_01275 TaxID=2903807 RepID=UPI002255B77A|nr:FxSxx-COOH system tetratricopeptide repeat protein [Streptomyces sp. NBC_01275]MCX4763911.1 FxSxx-COOH system tetratricopeptide repeat protein [Streptomyces sp. NBC_01275]